MKGQTMDMKEFAGVNYLSVEDVAGGALLKKIQIVEPGNFDKPVATFTDHSRLTLNKTNVSRLIKELGDDSRDWVGATVELSVGSIKFQGSEKQTIVVRALTEAEQADTPIPF